MRQITAVGSAEGFRCPEQAAHHRATQGNLETGSRTWVAEIQVEAGGMGKSKFSARPVQSHLCGREQDTDDSGDQQRILAGCEELPDRAVATYFR